jgi:hypothetical protein
MLPAASQLACDKFRYGFKVAAYGRAGCGAAAEVGEKRKMALAGDQHHRTRRAGRGKGNDPRRAAPCGARGVSALLVRVMRECPTWAAGESPTALGIATWGQACPRARGRPSRNCPQVAPAPTNPQHASHARREAAGPVARENPTRQCHNEEHQDHKPAGRGVRH